VRLEGLGQLKKFHLIGNRTSDLPACSIVPQPTTLPRAPYKTVQREILSLIINSHLGSCTELKTRGLQTIKRGVNELVSE
jgi:hypothetical protein